MNFQSTLLLSLFATFIILSGCTSIAPVVNSSPAIILDAQQSLHYYGSTYVVTLPKGRYEPAFQTDKGVFYTAPTSIVIQAMGHTADSGGVFIPRQNSTDQRQGFWFQAYPGHYITLRDPLRYRYSP